MIMGFKKPIDYNTLHHNLYMAGVELHSGRNDGYIQWEIKQDLYRLKWLIDNILHNAPTFEGEQEFLKEHQAAEVWHIMKS